MRTTWPSYTGSNDHFWKHEWEKHGTCAYPVLQDEHQYFRTVLDLHQRLDLQAAFDKAGLIADAEDPYPSRDIVAAVQQKLDVRPVLHCSDGALLEVWVCLDRQLEPISCPDNLAPHQGEELARSLVAGREDERLPAWVRWAASLFRPPLVPPRAGDEDQDHHHHAQDDSARKHESLAAWQHVNNACGTHVRLPPVPAG